MNQFADTDDAIYADFEYVKKMILVHERDGSPFDSIPYETLLFQSCSLPLIDMLESLIAHLDNIVLEEEDDTDDDLYALIQNEDYRSNLLYDCLAIAVKEKHDDVSRLLLEFVIKKKSVTTLSEVRYTVLHCAAANGDVDIIERLIKSGIDVNQANRKEETALHFAPDAATAEVLLANGADVSGTKRVGRTPSYYAFARYRFGVMRKLIENGATPNLGSVKLNEVCRSGDESRIAKSLLDFCVGDLLVPNGCVFDALSGGVKRYENKHQWHREMCNSCLSGSQPMVTEFLAQNATVITHGAYPPLHNAISHFYKKSEPKDSDTEKIKTILMEVNTDVNAVDKSGTTALYIAVERNLIEVASLLLDSGADPNLTTSGKYPLIVACRYLSYEFVKLLLSRGADPNVSECQCKSPLGIAAESFDHPLVALLVEHGADVHHRDRRGRTALSSIIEDLQHNMHSCPPSTGSCIEIVKYLLDNGSDVNQTTEHGGSLLYSAISLQSCRSGPFFRRSVLHRLIDLLLERGADAKYADVLYASICDRSYHVIRKLLKHGADPNQISIGLVSDMSTSLSVSCEFSDVHCARILLAAGANPDLIDWSLFGASAPFNIEMINLLLDSGMKLNVLSENKRMSELTEFFVTRCDEAKWVSELFKAGSDLQFLESCCKYKEETIQDGYCGSLGGRLCQAIVLAGHNVQLLQLIQQLRESGRPQDHDLVAWLEENSMTPLSLSCLSRIVIRRQLSAASGYRTILPLIDVLPIPNNMQLYLKFEGPCSEVDLMALDGGQKSDSCSCEVEEVECF